MSMTVPEYVEFNEGFRRYKYLDTEGIETIGIGFNLEEGFSRYECLLILQHRLGVLRDRLRHELSWFVRLDDIRQMVLLDMAYNLGVGGLRGFKKMLAALDERDYDKAAEELLDSRYARQVGARAERNAYMLRTGQWYEDLS